MEPELEVEFELEEKKEIEPVFELDFKVTEHNELTGRDEDNCHPINAITGLESALGEKQDKLTQGRGIEIEDNVISNTGVLKVEEGSENGTISVDGEDVEVKGLGSAAFTDSDQYATASQGEKADSAVQPEEMEEYIGDATLTIQRNSTTVDTFTANSKTDTVVNIEVPTQPSDIGAQAELTQEQMAAVNSGINSQKVGQIETNKSNIANIDALIPAQATSSNQLADKAFVNSTTQTATANFRGNWDDWADVPVNAEEYPLDYAQSRTPTVNDYLVVQDASGYTGETLTGTWRFKYSGEWSVNGKNGWHPEYQVNETPLTAAQLAALNSGATQDNIAQISTNKNSIGTLSSLTTTDKSSLVGALNELNSSKQATITGGASTITSSNLTANRALISNAQGKVAVSPVTNTELGYLSGATSSIQTQLNGKASTSLDNLTSTGKNIGNWSTNVSNCITEIPQDIKLELNNGTLTLKAGTKFYTADGSQYSLASDVTVGVGGANAPYFIFPQTGGTVSYAQVSVCYSGSTEPTGIGQSAFWLDTANNVIKYTSNSGSTWSTTTYGLPVAICTPSSGSWASIDQVFNGAGYIGHHAFVLPGVKGLLPNGFNSDGTLNSAISNKNYLSIIELTNNANYFTSCLGGLGAINKHRKYHDVNDSNEIDTTQAYSCWYIKNLNKFAYISGGSIIYSNETVLFTYSSDSSSQVTQFDIRQPVRLATTEMLDSVSDNVSTLDAQNVKLTGNQTIAGTKTFSSTISGSITGNAGTVTNGVYTTGNQTIAGNKTFSGAVSLGGSATATTPASSDNDTSVATTAWGNTLVNGMRSNCMRYIPQDILLDLAADGTLTLKSGSVITAPDGTQKQTTADKTKASATNVDGQYMVFPAIADGAIQNPRPISAIFSGSTEPTGVSGGVWLNTSNNKMYSWAGSSWAEWAVALPIAIITYESNVITSIDQIFNGAGYIGHHAFLLPNISGLQANGFNPDGTLLSVIRTNSVLRIVEMQTGQGVTGYNRWFGMVWANAIQRYAFYQEYNTRSEAPLGTAFRYCYIKDENKILFCTTNNGTIYKSNDVMFIEYNYDGTKVTLFNVKQPIRMATTEMLDNFLKSISGYNPSSTQTLKNVNGVFTWVTD